MRIENDIKLDFDDVLIRPKRSSLKSRKEVDLEREFTFKYSPKKWKGIPIIAANMDTTGTFEMSTVFSKHKMLTAIHKHYLLQDWKDQVSLRNLNVAISIGTKKEDLQFLDILMASVYKDIDFIIIDVANGYGEYLIDFIQRVREKYPYHIIAAGNVVTGDMTEQLILSGADIVKIGVGPGSSCKTRLVAGVGYPQLSAIIECADAAHGLGGHIIADGGCRVPGDITKAFGAGGDFVMIGGMLAGTDEAAGDVYTENKKGEYIWENGQYHLDVKEVKFKIFYGMSSNTAQEKYDGEQKEYRASEGRTLRVPYKGPVKNTIQEIFGGLRSALTYTGSKRLKDFPKCCTFIRVNNQYNNIFEKYEEDL